jgi:hypothetical protein
MKVGLFVSIICCLMGNIFAQDCETRSITLMAQSLSESSGLLFLDGSFVTLNDSGGEAELYEIDTASGTIQRTVTIQNATNVDWDAIVADDNFIYIGDIGNNSGTRTNLKLYKISISDFNTSNSVTAEIINFNYSNQASFISQPNDTRFDAEALAVVNGDLLLFSKNWKGNMSSYYSIPKIPGTYSIAPIDSIQTQGKITDAVYLPTKNQLFLVGYAIEPFVQTIRNISGTDLLNATHYSCLLDVANSIQVEGLCSDGERVFYSSEYFSFSSINLEGEMGEITYAMSLGVIENESSKIKVRNSTDYFQFETENFKIKKVEVFDTLGSLKQTKKTNEKTFTLHKNQYAKGCYIIQLSLSNNQLERIKLIID